MSKNSTFLRSLKKQIIRLTWRHDRHSFYRIDSDSVASWFDKTQSLVFSDEDAAKEESILIPLIKKIITSDSSVLDIGCGNGRYARALLPDIVEYVGTDISKGFIDSATTEFSDSKAVFIHSPAHKFIIEKKFDVILMIGLLTYMNDDEIVEMISNCHNMLKPGGRIIVRNVGSNESVRIFYGGYWNLKRILQKLPKYQIIRRPNAETLNFFSSFKMIHEQQIPNTGYKLNIFKL